MAVDFTPIGALLANRGRARMMDALLDGRELTAGELAQIAGVAPSTASGHLAELVDGGLATVREAGRRRHFRIAGAEIAAALEALARVCPPSDVRTLRQSAEARRIRVARTCYDHLAGLVAVRLLDALTARRALRPDVEGFRVTRSGRELFAGLGVDVDAAAARRRAFARPCVDWTERRPHLAGALGAATVEALFERGWFTRAPRSRGLVVTDAGRSGLAEVFAIELDDAADAHNPARLSA